MWKAIVSEEDIAEVMAVFGDFHDSCLRDIYISTREYVDDRGAMYFDNKLEGSLLFQRQFKRNPVLELKFEDVEHFNFRPQDLAGSSVIYDATLMIRDGLYYWADFKGWQIGDNDAVWISGKKLFWRLLPGLTGYVKRVMD